MTDDDGVALTSMSHPVPPWWRRVLSRIRWKFRRWPRKGTTETVTIDLPEK
jgi:hypothetical protein